MHEYIFIPLAFPVELSIGEKLDSILKIFKAPSDVDALKILKTQPGYVFRKLNPASILINSSESELEEEMDFKKML